MIKLRPCVFSDWKMLLNWKNDPLSLEASFQSEAVSVYTHKKWLAHNMQYIHILENEKEALGSIRNEPLETGEQVLSWVISPSHRKKGYGTLLLRTFLESNEGHFIAIIKKNNMVSRKIAERGNFQLKQEKEDRWILEKKNLKNEKKLSS